jgi:hypothetical protein
VEREIFMIRQQFPTDERTNGKLYNFMEFKKKKPFFMKPIKITVGNPINDTFYMMENVVYKGRQILALKQEHDAKTIVLVEANIEGGQLIHISMLPKDFLGDISRMLKGIM